MRLAGWAKNHVELTVAFVAVAMAFAAVVVAYYTTSLMREQARLSFKPSVWLETNTRICHKDDENDAQGRL